MAHAARDAITAAGAVPLLVALLRSYKPAVQDKAAGVSGVFQMALSKAQMPLLQQALCLCLLLQWGHRSQVDKRH